MQFRAKSVCSALAVATLWAVAGCGGPGSSSPTTVGTDGQQPGAAARQPAQDDPLHPTVRIETSLGNITLRLDAEKAPLTVDNFLGYVERGHYEGTIFHQVLKELPQVVIGGAFTAELVEKPGGTPVRNEADNGLHNRRGTIAMARQGDAIDSATCHFFSNVSDNQAVLDHKDRTAEGYGYCVFGEITEGLDVLDKIAAVEVHDTDRFEQIPKEPVLIKSIHRLH